MANFDKFITDITNKICDSQFLANIVKVFDTSIQQANRNPEASTNLFSRFTTAGDKLLAINTFSMVLAAITNTAAAAVDKNTSKEDKKFLVPAGLATGVANIGVYFAMTRKIIQSLAGDDNHIGYADKIIDKMTEDGSISKNVIGYVEKTITNAESTKSFKKYSEVLQDVKDTLSKSPNIKDILKECKLPEEALTKPEELVQTEYDVLKTLLKNPNAKEILKDKDAKLIGKAMEKIRPLQDMRKYFLEKPNINVKDITKAILKSEARTEYGYSVKDAASVMGSFIGVVIGCGIIATIFRDVSAYFVQKHLEKKNPSYKDKPYRPYFDPSHFKIGYAKTKQPLNMNTYMAFTRAKLPNSTMTI